jgi:MazG family protein
MDIKRASVNFSKLLRIVEKLRSPNGCSWDKKQTHETLLPYFLEETYEVIESIDNKNWQNLEEELGDVLLHVVLQSQIAKEDKKFNISDLLNVLNKKLIRRHPHIFSNKKINDKISVKQNWEEIKHKEKKRESRLDGVPIALPALIRAQRLQEKASYTGFDWDKIDDAWDKMDEEIGELRDAIKNKDTENIKEEIGDVLFSIVNISRKLNFPAEDMLRKTNKKFEIRFKGIEKVLKNRGKRIEETSLEEMEKIWINQKNK